jgi:hypothetical protein
LSTPRATIEANGHALRLTDALPAPPFPLPGSFVYNFGKVLPDRHDRAFRTMRITKKIHEYNEMKNQRQPETASLSLTGVPPLFSPGHCPLIFPQAARERIA